jgi:hypothetical protein
MLFPFAELTLADGRKLDVPAASVLFLEGLDPDARKAHRGCKAGLFYDLGPVQGDPAGTTTVRSALVKEDYSTLVEIVRGASPHPRVEVKTTREQPALMLVANVESLLELPADHDGGGACQIMHRLGTRLLRCDVVQTRDELRAAMQAAVAPPETE